jgi:hypothetical protein
MSMRKLALCGRRAKQDRLVALIDDADYVAVAQFDWYPQLCKSGRRPVMRHIFLPGKHATEFLHNFLIGVIGVDHIDRNPLNNQRSNLRVATAGQNARNASKRRNAQTSAFKGVSLYRNGKWVAQIQVDRRKVHLGYFATAIDAALAYDGAARRLFGEFAVLNFPAVPDA